MAIFKSFLLGNVKQSVSNLTMYIAKGVSIVRGKPLNVHNPRTQKQIIQREKMKALTGLVRSFKPALAIGFPRTSGLVSSSNRFVRANMEAVTVDDDFKATVDFSKLVCSAESLKTPKVTVTFKQEEGQFVFSQAVQRDSVICSGTDVVFAVVYEKAQRESEVFQLNTRKKGGETIASLPEDWEIENCEFYAFARNQEGTQTSATSYLTPDIV